jgi:predicted transcriptional regulator
MDMKELYPAFRAASEAIANFYQPVFAEYAEKFQITPHEICILSAAPTFEPKPVSAAILNVRSPYTSPAYYLAILDKLTTAGLMESIEPGQYHLTENGLNTLKLTMNAVYTTLGGVQSLSVTKMMDLASRLKELADACMTAPDPPGTWCIQHARRMDPGSRSPMMVRVDQFLSELLAFHDDANLASWRNYDCSGHAWEILTLLWVEQEGTVESLNHSLKRRGFTVEETRETVKELLDKEWLRQENGSLRITPIGSEIRYTAEVTTERFYQERFSGYSRLELSRTLDLVKEHRRGLKI